MEGGHTCASCHMSDFTQNDDCEMREAEGAGSNKARTRVFASRTWARNRNPSVTKNSRKKAKKTAIAAAKVTEMAVNNLESGKNLEATNEGEADAPRTKVASEDFGEEELEHIETMRGRRFAVRPRDLQEADMLDPCRSARAATAAFKAQGLVAQHLRIGSNASGLLVYECKEWELSAEEDKFLNTMSTIQLSLDNMATVAIVRLDTPLVKVASDTQKLAAYMASAGLGELCCGVDLRLGKYRIDKANERYAVGWYEHAMCASGEL